MGLIYTQKTAMNGLLPEQLPAPGQIAYDIDADSNTLTSIDENGVVRTIGPAIYVFKKTFADFVGSSAVETIQLGIVPPGFIFQGAVVRVTSDFITSGFSSAIFKVQAKNPNQTQKINNVSNVLELVKFTADFAGNASGAANDDYASTIFNTTVESALELVLGVDSKFVGNVIEPIIGTRWMKTFQTVSGATLNEKYFLFSTSSQEYYVWYSTGPGSVDPAPGGFSGAPVGIQVDITAGNTAIEVAALTQQAVYPIISSVANVYQSANKIRFIGLADNVAALFDEDLGTSGFTLISTTDGGAPSANTIGDLTAGEVQIVVHGLVVPLVA